MKCDICGEELIINLMPEFSATAFWCNSCGVNYSNPNEDFPAIPSGLLSLIDGWVQLWDLLQDNTARINRERFRELIINMGIELCRQINNYYLCNFDPEKTVFIDEETI